MTKTSNQMKHCYISVTHLIHSIYNSRTSDHHKQSAMTQQREEEHTQILLVLETRKITNRYDSSVVFQPYKHHDSPEFSL